MSMASTSVPIPTLSKRTVLVLMGFLGLACAHIVIREGITAKLVLGSVVFLSAMLFFVKGFARGLLTREMLFYLFIVYIPFSKQIPADFGIKIPGINGTNILIGLLGLCWFLAKDREDGSGKKWISSPLNRPIAIFFLLGLLSVVRGVGYGPGYLTEAFIQYYRKWMIPFFLYFFALNTIRNRETLKNVIVIIMMTTVVVGLTAIYAYMDDPDKRVGGIFDDPNILASFFNYYMFLPVAFFMLNMGKAKYWALLIPALICFRGIMVTFSRAGYLAFVVSSYAATYFKGKFMLFILVAATLFLFMNPALLPEGVRYRLAQTIQKSSTPTYTTTVQIGQNQKLDESASDRVKVWRAAQTMIQDHPIFGIGFYLFESKILHYYPGKEAYDPHNQYLLIASEMGIPALLVFVWVLFKIFRNSHQLYRRTSDSFMKAISLGCMAGMFGLLVSNIYGSRLNYVEVTSYFWILAGLIVRTNMSEAAVAVKSIAGNEL